MNFNIYLSNYNYELFMKSVVRPLIQPKLKLKIRPFPTLFQLDFFLPCHGPPKKKKKNEKKTLLVCILSVLVNSCNKLFNLNGTIFGQIHVESPRTLNMTSKMN